MHRFSRALFLALALAPSVAPVSAATLSLAATPASVQVGDSFSVKVMVADVIDLYAFQFDLAFDPGLLQANDVLEGDFLSGSGGATFFLPGSIDNAAGAVVFTANTLLGPGSGVSGDGVLVELLFQALAAGHSDLMLGSAVLLDSAGEALNVTLVSGGIDVSAVGHVPEPAGLVLAGLALALAAAASRRKCRKA